MTNGNSNNLLHVRVQNHADHPITILRVRGQFREATGKERPLREVRQRPCFLPPSPLKPRVDRDTRIDHDDATRHARLSEIEIAVDPVPLPLGEQDR